MATIANSSPRPTNSFMRSGHLTNTAVRRIPWSYLTASRRPDVEKGSLASAAIPFGERSLAISAESNKVSWLQEKTNAVAKQLFAAAFDGGISPRLAVARIRRFVARGHHARAAAGIAAR